MNQLAAPTELIRLGAESLFAPLVHQRFERQAAVAPDAAAVRFLDRTLGYDALNRRANRLAHALRERGVRSGQRVVVCLEPSLDIAVALLGILKAGGVYVPIDPGYPLARVRAILEDTRPAVVLAEDALRLKFELPEATTLSVARLTEAEAEADHERNPEPGVAEHQPASVFYTSGSTGAPKGVVSSHANLRHYVEVAERRYGVGPGDVMPALARFSFSISLFELLTPLVSGATLRILPRAEVLEPRSLARALEEATIFHAGPSLLKGLIAHVRREYASFEAFERVKHASSGGDMVPPEVLEGLKQIFSNAEVFVIYGCSEISCMGCTYPVPRDRTVTKTYVGRPFEDMSVRLLSPDDRDVAPGDVGEIAFAGRGVTLGYLNRPELTAEKFVTLHGQRHYRTGDLGRFSEDGWLEMLGRSDFQVKIRGMRVELAEVESELKRAPGVRDAVAGAHAAADGEKLLVAYLVPDEAAAGAATKAQRLGAVRAQLTARLPDYMVPAVYVELERLPLNFNLKLDRRALPAPTEADFRALSVEDLRAPASETERAIAALFQRVLKLERVGLDDNFFELGGDSLRAVELCAGVERALGVPLEGMELLREPLEVLARLCDRKLGKESAAAARNGNAAVDRVETFYFGAERALYGVLRRHGEARSGTAALLCGAVGQEAVRSRFVLTKLARNLARDGVPALTFDYFGCGDSLGETADAPGTRFLDDLAQAAEELRRRTGAARVVAVGVRLGALLLAQVASRIGVERVVLWDPVRDGAEHFAELGRMQRDYLRSLAPLRLPNFRWQQSPPGELLGTQYSPDLIGTISSWRLEPRGDVPYVVRTLETNGTCGWSDLGRLEDVLPDLGISSRIRELLRETP